MTFLSHAHANMLILYIALFFAYVVVVTVAHIFKAWVALTLGDTTPAEHGFLSLNPIDHIDPIGMACLFIFGLGWGKPVPINGLNIHGRCRMARIAFAQLSDTLAYIFIGVVAMVALVFLFDSTIILVSSRQAFHGLLGYHTLHALYPSYSSLRIALGFVAICAMHLSIMLGALQFLINCFYLFMQHYMGRYKITGTTEILFMLVPVLLLFILVEPLRFFIMYSITLLSVGITQLIGIF